jgi:hypothetical protein
MKRIALFVLLLSSLSLAAQEKLRLDVDTIMRGPGLAGYTPRALRWSRDGKLLYFEWKQYSDPVVKDFDTYVVGRDGKGLRKLSDDEKKAAPPQNGNWTRDRKFAIYTDGGDVFLYDADAKKRRALTDTIDGESDARFTKDENRVTFVRDDNLYVFSLHDGSIAQVTNIVSSDAKGPNVTLFDDENKGKTASQKWVADEAKKLSDVIARRAANKKEDDAKKKAEIQLAPLKLKKGPTRSSSSRSSASSPTTAKAPLCRATSPPAATRPICRRGVKWATRRTRRAWPASRPATERFSG